MQPSALLLNIPTSFPAVELELYNGIKRTEVLTLIILTTLQILRFQN